MDGQRKALIVASDQYDHDGLRHLVAPAADAAALAGVLGDPKIGDFDVQVVRNESAHAVQERIEELLLEARPEDVLLLHFSCHGLKSESGELFFAARNTRPNRLGSTAIAADFVQRCMRASRSRSIVLLLDCCYGGAFGQGVAVRASGDVNVLDSFPGGKLGGGRGRAVITASNAMEYAFEGDRLADDHSQRPSVFTSALVDGLATGDADRDEDGWVSLNELYDYVFDRVRAETPHQTPGRDIEMSGELYLARSRRRRIRPLPIPADLQAAVTDPNVYTRLGAVAELRSRLGSDDLPMAAGAHEALLNVARHDIKYVAEVAAEALRDAALQVEVTQLTFGRAAHGSDPPHQTVRLLGPPLARACTSQTSHSWIRVEDTAGGLDVSVDTTVVGALRGQITITGLTGQTTLQVEVDISPDRDEESRQREASEPSHVDNATPDVEPPADATQGPPLPAARRAHGRTSATQHAPQHAGLVEVDPLDKIYDEASAAYWTEQWDRAVDLLQQIVSRQQEYRDAGDRLEHARRQQYLLTTYARACAAADRGDWAQAVSGFASIAESTPDYRDAAERLDKARWHERVESLQAEARRLHQAKQWAAVIRIGERLQELGPEFDDPEGMMTSARAGLEADAREQRLAEEYRAGLRHMDAGNWHRALESLKRVEQVDPTHKAVQRLIQRARELLAADFGIVIEEDLPPSAYSQLASLVLQP